MEEFEKALIKKLLRINTPIWRVDGIYYDEGGSLDVAVDVIPFIGYRYFTDQPNGWLALCDLLQEQKIQFISYHGIIGVNCSDLVFARLQENLEFYLDIQSFSYPAIDPMAGPLAAEILTLWGHQVIQINPLACGYVFYRPTTILSFSESPPQLLLEQSVRNVREGGLPLIIAHIPENTIAGNLVDLNRLIGGLGMNGRLRERRGSEVLLELGSLRNYDLLIRSLNHPPQRVEALITTGSVVEIVTRLPESYAISADGTLRDLLPEQKSSPWNNEYWKQMGELSVLAYVNK